MTQFWVCFKDPWVFVANICSLYFKMLSPDKSFMNHGHSPFTTSSLPFCLRSPWVSSINLSQLDCLIVIHSFTNSGRRELGSRCILSGYGLRTDSSILWSSISLQSSSGPTMSRAMGKLLATGFGEQLFIQLCCSQYLAKRRWSPTHGRSITSWRFQEVWSFGLRSSQLTVLWLHFCTSLQNMQELSLGCSRVLFSGYRPCVSQSCACSETFHGNSKLVTERSWDFG